MPASASELQPIAASHYGASCAQHRVQAALDSWQLQQFQQLKENFAGLFACNCCSAMGWLHCQAAGVIISRRHVQCVAAFAPMTSVSALRRLMFPNSVAWVWRA